MADAPACTNCGGALPPQARFCPHCAQRTRYGPRTLRETVQEVVGRDYAQDGRLWLTLRHLVVPGKLSVEWFAGRQQRYLGPMRLLLLVLLVVVVCLQLIIRLAVPGTGGMPDAGWRVEHVFGPAGTAHAPLLEEKRGSVLVRVHGGWLQPVLQPWADRVKPSMARLDETELRLRVRNVTTPARWHGLLLVQVPLLVALLALAHAGQGRRLAEHAVFTLHFAAFAMAASLVLGAPLELLGGAIPVGEVIGAVIALWFTLALRRFYGGAWWAVGLRAAGVLAALLVPLPYLDTLVALSTLS